MNNLWLLTEERPKPSVVKQILDIFCNDFNEKSTIVNQLAIKPVIERGIFKFIYIVEGIKVSNINNIYIKTVSGSSSFLDFLLFKQVNEPKEGNPSDNLIMAIEETKTSDDESRNTGVYQRGSKFVYIEPYYKNVKLYMLYNEELGGKIGKQPSDTGIFGTNILLTLGIEIIGKDTSKWYRKFNSLDELILFKSKMRKPPAGNVPIDITKKGNVITISGRLAKPADAGNIGHDPNIGALSMISKCIRKLGWEGRIIITKHGVTQSYIDKTRGKNKFLYICQILNIELEDIILPKKVEMPELYWHYEMKSEKMASILLHMICMYDGIDCIYENHAGCERGYFKDKNNNLVTIHKKDKKGINLYLPDVVLYNKKVKEILLVEGKKLETLQDGVNEIEYYDSIENEYIKPSYKESTIYRWVSIFGGLKKEIPHNKVLIYLNLNGNIFINQKSPKWFIEMLKKYGVNV